MLSILTLTAYTILSIKISKYYANDLIPVIVVGFFIDVLVLIAIIVIIAESVCA